MGAESPALTTLSHQMFLPSTMGIPLLTFILPALAFLSHVTWSFCNAGASATCWLCWTAQVAEGADPPSWSEVPPTHPVTSHPVTSSPDFPPEPPDRKNIPSMRVFKRRRNASAGQLKIEPCDVYTQEVESAASLGPVAVTTPLRTQPACSAVGGA